VYRYTKEVEIFGKLLKQFFFTSLITFAYAGYKYKHLTTQEVGFYILSSFVLIALLKYSIYIFLKKYRLLYGGNFRNVVIVGNGKSAEELELFFNKNLDYGYHLFQIFNLKTNKNEELEVCKKFVVANKIDSTPKE
jgi:putative colanic acid biosynthesis UDP-glucose lipid carrier transferase